MVFVRRENKVEPGFPIGAVLNRNKTSGQVGLEIEVEGNKFPKVAGYEDAHKPVKLPDLPKWSYVKDGSLRGEDNAEYVLTVPLSFEQAKSAVSEIYAKMAAFGSVLTESNRTSVHVHLNCQEFHFNRLTSFIAMYFAFEDVLTEWCGDHRVGNLFCLRAKDAPAIVSQVKRFIRSDGRYELRDHLHYAGLNTNALHKFGSLEIRTLRGVSDEHTVIEWIGILQRLYEKSAEFTDPREICSIFSQSGPMAFFETILGPMSTVVRSGTTMTDDAICDSMYEGIRLAQDICYCRDWDVFKAVTIKPDPFGRSAGKVMKKLQNAEMAVTGAEVTSGWATATGTVSVYGNPFNATVSNEEPDFDPEYD